MSEIIRLKDLIHEDSLGMDQNIEFHKALSMGESYAKETIKPEFCLLCKSSKNQFCNSHSVPARCLRAIASNGDVKVFNGLIKIPAVDTSKGINETGTFKLICRDCDDKVFKDYETFEKYPSDNLPDKILHEIALKNYLKYYYKKVLEENAFPKMLENFGMKNSNLLDPVLNPGNRDKKDTLKSIYEVKKLLNNNTNGYYRVLEYTKLPYSCPLAFQGVISLITGFDGEIINDIFDMDRNYNIQDMHICILPEKDYSYIIVFLKNHFTRYSKFAKHYNGLTIEERLQLLLFIIFKYSEDFYYSAQIQDIEKNTDIMEALSTTTMMFCEYGEPDDAKIKKCIEEHDLNKYKKIPNILSQEYLKSLNR